MPRKKKEDETTSETIAETGENEATEIASDESNVDENQVLASDNTTTTETDESSILDNVVDTVTSIAGSVAETVSDGVSAIVSTVAGNSDENGKKAKVHKRAEKVGVVSSDKMTNTVVVRVDRVVKHPVYRKYIKRRKKFMAHDESGAAIGDKVRIVETRPLSAHKRWRVVEIIQKAEK